MRQPSCYQLCITEDMLPAKLDSSERFLKVFYISEKSVQHRNPNIFLLFFDYGSDGWASSALRSSNSSGQSDQSFPINSQTYSFLGFPLVVLPSKNANMCHSYAKSRRILSFSNGLGRWTSTSPLKIYSLVFFSIHRIFNICL